MSTLPQGQGMLQARLCSYAKCDNRGLEDELDSITHVGEDSSCWHAFMRDLLVSTGD